MTIQPVDEVTNLIIEEVDLLDFKIPTYDEVLSAYSDSYVDEMTVKEMTLEEMKVQAMSVQEKKLYHGPDRRISEESAPAYNGPDRRAYPPNPRFSKPKSIEPGYSIDDEEDPLPI